MFMKFLMMHSCILFKTPASTTPPPIITMFNHVITDLARYKNIKISFEFRIQSYSKLDNESESE